MTALSMMRDTCTVTARTQSRGSAGELSTTGATSLTGLRVMLDVTSDEPQAGDKERPVLRGQAYFPYGTAIAATDIFTMTSGQHNGRVFVIKSEPTDEVGRASHLVCQVESKTGGPQR